MSDLLSNVNAVYALLIVIAGGLLGFLVKVRKEWASSKTNALMEAAQQSGLASVIAALAGAQVREKEAWALVTQGRIDRDSLMGEMGRMRESLAAITEREENCQAQMADLRAAMENAVNQNRANEKHLRNQIQDLSARMHDMSNRYVGKGGTLTGTDIFPKESQ